MAFTHGRNAAFYLTDTVATQRNLSAFIDSIEVSWDEDASETTTLGASAKTFIPGLASGSISLAGKWDSGATATPDQYLTGLLAAGTIVPSFVYCPAGSASTRPYESGSAVLTGYSVASPVGDVVTWKASLTTSGAITRGTL
jgi:hypothetical protein